MSYTLNLDNGHSIKLESVMRFKDIIFVGLTILIILAFIIEFDLQIKFAIHINMILVYEGRENFFFLETLTF